MTRPNIPAACMALVLAGFPALAQAEGATGEALTAFPWWRHCENLSVASRLLDTSHQISVGFQIAVIALSVLLLVFGLRTARRASSWMPPPRYETLALLALTALVVFGGRRALGVGTPNGVEQLLWALRPSAARPPLDDLLNGGLSYWVHWFSPSVELLLFLNALMAFLGLGLVYLIALLVWENRRVALAAMALAGLSAPFLGGFAVDLPLHLVTTTALGAVAALLLAMYHGKRIGWIALLPLAVAAVTLAPATLAPLLLVLPVGAREGRPPATQRAATALWISALATGLWVRLSLGTQDTVLDLALVRQGAGLSLVTALCLFVGVALCIRSRQLPPLFLALAGFAALVVLPTHPSSFVVSGLYAWLGVALFAPLIARGAWQLGTWVSPARAHWVFFLLLAGMAIPTLVAVRTAPLSAVEQVYRFEADLVRDLSAEQRVLYLNIHRPGGLPPMAAFLAPRGGALCLRSRDELPKDPASHGEQWIYFGPECALESPRGEPSPSGCRFYRLVYALSDCRHYPVLYTRPDGRPVEGAELSACRVLGPAQDRR